MKFFEWNKNYATGVREIDSQHAYLFALTNRLILHATSGTVASELAKILDELRTYVKDHFSYEESLMDQAGYRYLNEHRAHHVRLRERLELYMTELENGILTPEELIDFLKTWLTMHIMREDMKYIPALERLRNQ